MTHNDGLTFCLDGHFDELRLLAVAGLARCHALGARRVTHLVSLYLSSLQDIWQIVLMLRAIEIIALLVGVFGVTRCVLDRGTASTWLCTNRLGFPLSYGGL